MGVGRWTSFSVVVCQAYLAINVFDCKEAGKFKGSYMSCQQSSLINDKRKGREYNEDIRGLGWHGSFDFGR